ncbi:MAG: hypothetical protein H6715_01875 [Myxococcales bacterium]|nr:hypothetical protein [Myxococcales bacterium]
MAVLLGKSDPIQTLNLLISLTARKMQRFELNDIDEIRVIVGKKSRTLWQRDRRDAQRAQWVDKSKPDQRNELYGNWLRAVDALQVSDYLPPKVEPGQEGKGIAKTKARVLELVYTKEGAIKGTLRIDRVDGPTPEYFAQSGATHSWVRLVASSAKRVVEDAAVVVNGQSAPARNQPPQHQPPLQSLPHSPSAPPPAHP